MSIPVLADRRTILRRGAVPTTARGGWLGALRDSQVGRAIALIHRDPARPWTVALLAREAAMSRSAFAARFAELAGEPPMRYVARWRMHVALTRLKEDDATLDEIAGRLGYQSEAAFSRTFKRLIGIPPAPPAATATSRANPDPHRPPRSDGFSRHRAGRPHIKLLNRRPVTAATLYTRQPARAAAPARVRSA